MLTVYQSTARRKLPLHVSFTLYSKCTNTQKRVAPSCTVCLQTSEFLNILEYFNQLKYHKSTLNHMEWFLIQRQSSKLFMLAFNQIDVSSLHQDKLEHP